MDHRCRTVLAMDCVLAGTEWQHGRPLNEIVSCHSKAAVKFREMKAADVPGLFYVRPRTRENAMTLEELQRLGINPQSVKESLSKSTKGWVCDDSDQVVAFSMPIARLENSWPSPCFLSTREKASGAGS